MNRKLVLGIAGLAVTALAYTVPAASPDPGQLDLPTKRVQITYENLTAGQAFSSAAFFSHSPAAPPLFAEGKAASFGLMRLAEEGNPAPLLAGIVKTLGGAYGSATEHVPVPPGGKATVYLEVSREFQLISGAWMLAMTNDGFSGVHDIQAWSLDKPIEIDLFAWDAGTENNNEKGDFLIAMEGTARDPENDVVRRHEGLRGDADAPGSWKFDPQRPVARVTIAPAP
jgi:hypothetical protein